MVKYYAKALLKKKREDLGSQREMAALISADGKFELKRAYYEHIELGTRPIDAQLALHIARILKTEVNEVFESKNE